MNAEKKPCLKLDDEGAIMVIALFAGIFLVGALYAVLGVGDAILHRRTMQDAADAGAFAASVVAAKGMNLHALLNVTMAVTAGILLVLRSVEVLLEILLAILEGLTATLVLAPKALALIAAITPAEATVEKIADAVEQFVRAAHDALDVAHHVVQRGYPILAEARAVDLMAFEGTYDPPVTGGFVLPVLGARLPNGGRGLPVEETDGEVACDRVASALGRRLDKVKAGVPRWVLRFLGGIVERALSLGKRRACDDSVVEPPRAVIAARSDGSEVWLGHEEFQYRSFDFGEDPTGGSWRTGERGVRVARGGRSGEGDVLRQMHVVGRIGLAQAEFYFNGSEDKSEWLWKQRWRARLRRFRIDRELLPDGIVSACTGSRGVFRQGASGVCDVLRDFAVNAVSAH